MKSQRFFLTIVFALIVIGLITTVNFSGSLAQDEDELPDIGESLELLQEMQGELQDYEMRLSDIEESLNTFVSSAEISVLDRSQDIPDPPEGQIALRLSFRYEPDSLPGNGIRVYQPLPEVSSLWAMEELSEGETIPVGDVIQDNIVFLEPGEMQTVTLVFDNPEAEDIGFMAMPHQDTPGALGPDTWLTCFCFAFIYQAPANGAWYRVINVGVSPGIPVGSKVDALWTILTDPAVFAMEEVALAPREDTTTQSEADSEVVALGQSLAAQNGCAACHSTDGSPGIGPTWLGLFGEERLLEDGSSVLADEDYLRESIVNPNAAIAQGFVPNVMPQDFGERLSDEAIVALIEYIKTVR
jgi:mono/diheme cytochrome c family protein